MKWVCSPAVSANTVLPDSHKVQRDADRQVLVKSAVVAQGAAMIIQCHELQLVSDWAELWENERERAHIVVVVRDVRQEMPFQRR